MNTLAVVSMMVAIILFIVFTKLTIIESLSMQQVILSGLMLAAALICMSNIEK